MKGAQGAIAAARVSRTFVHRPVLATVLAIASVWTLRALEDLRSERVDGLLAAPHVYRPGEPPFTASAALTALLVVVYYVLFLCRGPRVARLCAFGAALVATFLFVNRILVPAPDLEPVEVGHLGSAAASETHAVHRVAAVPESQREVEQIIDEISVHHDDSAGAESLVLRRVCSRSRTESDLPGAFAVCSWGVSPPSELAPLPAGLVEYGSLPFAASWDTWLQIDWVPDLRLWAVSERPHAVPAPVETHSFDGHTGDFLVRALTRADVRAPPSGTLWGTTSLAALVSLALLVVIERLYRRARAASAAPAGRVEGGVLVASEDGVEGALVVGGGLADGPVTVLGSARRAHSYRDTATIDAALLVPGEPREVARELRSRASALQIPLLALLATVTLPVVIAWSSAPPEPIPRDHVSSTLRVIPGQ